MAAMPEPVAKLLDAALVGELTVVDGPGDRSPTRSSRCGTASGST